MITLIAAMDRQNVIGQDGKLPWHLPEDLKWFRRHTEGRNCIVGSKTFAGLPPLEGRTLHVASEGNLTELLTSVENPVVIGGARIYEQTIHKCDRMYLTYVHRPLAEGGRGDAFFPSFDHDNWRIESTEHFKADERNAYDMTFVVLVRTKPHYTHRAIDYDL